MDELELRFGRIVVAIIAAAWLIGLISTMVEWNGPAPVQSRPIAFAVSVLALANIVLYLCTIGIMLAARRKRPIERGRESLAQFLRRNRGFVLVLAPLVFFTALSFTELFDPGWPFKALLLNATLHVNGIWMLFEFTGVVREKEPVGV